MDWWETERTEIDTFCDKIIKYCPQETGFYDGRLRASELQKICPRYAYYRHFEYRPLKFSKQFIISMWLGTNFHSFLQNNILGPLQILEGWWVKGTERKYGTMPGSDWKYEEERFYDDEMNITGHADGTIQWQGQKINLEIKTTNDWYYQNEKFLDDYLWQANLYMYLKKMEKTLFLIVNVDESIKKRNLVLRGILYPFDREIFEKAHDKAVYIKDAIEQRKVPEGTCVDMNNKKAKKCPFYKECLKLTAKE